ncbi:MAG: ABC transporter permease [Candidatus Aminicenantaceae bacterium]
MIRNYIKTAFRNLKRYKGYSFINLMGLAIGIACCILILLYMQDEFSYDRYPQDYEQIYRITFHLQTPDRGEINTARTPPPWAPSLAEDYPEVESYCRLKTPLVSWLVSREEIDKRFHEKGFYFADETVFDLFNFALKKGDPQTALKEPKTLVLTETAAQKYFGSEDPMGKTLRLDNTYDFLITGVMEDVPKNSHFSFDILASFSTLGVVPIYGGIEYVTWRNGLGADLYTYIRLKDGVAPTAIEEKMPEFFQKYLGNIINQVNIKINPRLQPLASIHLHSNLDAEIRANSDIRYIYIFSAIAIFILLIACINFMNLATARSAIRAQEVGMRKVIGAEKKQLVFQFFGETVFLAFLALILALILVFVFLPVFNSLSGKLMEPAIWNPWILLGIVGITVFVGIVSGSYPALFLSSFQPVAVFRGSLKAGKANAMLRKALVIFQFALSIVFIIGTGIIYDQLRFIRNRDLGFDKEQIVVLPMGDPRARQVYQTFKDKALQDPSVLAVSGTSSVPGGLIGVLLFLPEDAQAGEDVTMEHFMVDHDFIDAMGLEVIEGRTFSLEYSTDTLEAFILNEAAVKHMGWEGEAIDKRINIGGFKRGRVIGVVNDFHAKSLHQKIEPLLIHIAPTPDPFIQLIVRIAPYNYDKTLNSIEDAWKEVYPRDPFVYSFLDDDYDNLYRTEKQRGKVFLAFSVFAIFIACLGLFGLASFTSEQKTKEIGIRKVLGATVGNIVKLLSVEFVKLVLLANLIAWPVSYYIMHNWLGNFAYRTNINIVTFVVVGVVALIIALATVSFHAVRAALANPADSLRTE